MEIYDLLCRLGVTPNYTGFFHAAFAVRLCMEQPARLQLVTKWVYPDVARRYQTSWKAVERNIRTVGDLIWRYHRPLLEELAGRQLPRRPANAQLLAILLNGLRPSPAPHSPGKAAAPGARHPFLDAQA